MIQSKIIEELINTYSEAEKCYKENQSSLFYKCLRHTLLKKIDSCKEDKQRILKQYEMSCKSYLDSDILNFNIVLGTFMVSIITLIGIKANSFLIFITLIPFAAAWGIYNHKKNRKLRELLFVIEEENKK